MLILLTRVLCAGLSSNCQQALPRLLTSSFASCAQVLNLVSMCVCKPASSSRDHKLILYRIASDSATSSSDSIVQPITNYIDGEFDALFNRVDPTLLTFRDAMQACAPPRPARSLTSAMHPASSLKAVPRISSLDPSSPPHSTSSSTTLAVFDRCCAPSILATTPTVSLRSLVLLR